MFVNSWFLFVCIYLSWFSNVEEGRVLLRLEDSLSESTSMRESLKSLTFVLIKVRSWGRIEDIESVRWLTLGNKEALVTVWSWDDAINMSLWLPHDDLSFVVMWFLDADIAGSLDTWIDRWKCSNCVAGIDIEMDLSVILLGIEVYLRMLLGKGEGDGDGVLSPLSSVAEAEASCILAHAR